MESLWKDLGLSFRALRRSPAFTAAAIASLALGIGANTLIFIFLNAFFLKGLPVADPERLVAIYSVDLRSNPSSSMMTTGGVRPSDVGDPQFDTDAQAEENMQDTNSTLHLFADNTGGKAFLGGGNLVQAFRQAVQDDSSYYVLGYYVHPNNTKPGWHDISVAAGIDRNRTVPCIGGRRS